MYGENIPNKLEPIAISGIEKILYQMKNCVCKVKVKGLSGTGFFCIIPTGNKKMICLITSYQLLNEKYFNINNKINILFNDNKEAKEIYLDKKREKYFNPKFDITIIEIIKSDGINHYLELDDNLFKNEINIFYDEKSIYSIQYPQGNNISVSYGILNNINNNYIINHTCNIIKGAYCSPIMNLSNNKVIGINNEFSFDSGILLNYPLNDFINKIKLKQKPNLNIDILNNNKVNTFRKKIIKQINFTENDYKDQKNNKFLINSNTLPNFNNFPCNFSNNNPKINIIFNHYNGMKTTLITEYGTTIDQLLKEYLIRINRAEFINTNEYTFMYNSRKIQFGDQTPVENIFYKQSRVEVLKRNS